jgi:hypothetical protein
MAKAALHNASAQQKLVDVIALIDPRNSRSRFVAQRTGFRFERNIAWKSGPAMLYRMNPTIR